VIVVLRQRRPSIIEACEHIGPCLKMLLPPGSKPGNPPIDGAGETGAHRADLRDPDPGQIGERTGREVLRNFEMAVARTCTGAV